jgi:hypothetical protein
MPRVLHLQGIFHDYLTLKAFHSIFCRIIMAIDLELWFIRSVLFIGIAPDLGPKLVMIRQMVCLLSEDDFTLYF